MQKDQNDMDNAYSLLQKLAEDRAAYEAEIAEEEIAAAEEADRLWHENYEQSMRDQEEFE